MRFCDWRKKKKNVFWNFRPYYDLKSEIQPTLHAEHCLEIPNEYVLVIDSRLAMQDLARWLEADDCEKAQFALWSSPAPNTA